MSMFRRPSDISSSEESSDNAHKEQQQPQETSAPQHGNLLSRINTMSESPSGESSDQQTPATRPGLPRSNTKIRELLLHSLLEEKAISEAAAHLGKDKNDPQVQELAGTTYQALARQLSSNPDYTYAREDMRQHRAAAQEGINQATRSHLADVTAGRGQALVAQPMNNMPFQPAFSASPFGLENVVSSLSIPLAQNYPGLHTNRYSREFLEVHMVGKGGFGKVYKVQHKLDNTFYAVKRIMVSPSRLQKIQENGPSEMESILEEVRSLARFDHGNIVRYHNAWLEFTTGSISMPNVSQTMPPKRLLQDVSQQSFSSTNTKDLDTDLGNLSFGDPTNQGGGGADDSLNIVFETSDHDIEANQPKSDRNDRNRRSSHASQATVATISSSHSLMAAMKDAGEEDEDIETIPRKHPPQSRRSTEVSPSLISDSDVPANVVGARSSAPILTLNVQMSLYDTNLAAFLSPEQITFESNPQLRHCFHSCISLEMLKKVISGVEYLHAQGVVHRDLKPANIFLSLSTSRVPPSGSIDLSGCKPCPDRERVYITPRIGDFGLVAALGETDTIAKPVGTEFYRPAGAERVSEKLDIFALGVVGFEMLQKFGTAMERVNALNSLRQGVFPEDFIQSLDQQAEGGHGTKMQELIKGMTCADGNERLSCEEVKKELGRLVHLMKA